MTKNKKKYLINVKIFNNKNIDGIEKYFGILAKLASQRVKYNDSIFFVILYPLKHLVRKI